MQQIIDFTWKILSVDKYIPIMRLREVGSNEVKSLELESYKFNFKLSKEKYCIGYFKNSEMVPCKLSDPITKLGKILDKSTYTQCPTCERLQGFKSAFLFGEEANENAKEYLSQKHYVYLAYFEPGIIKVGTASDSRRDKRLIEQDALVYCFIAESKEDDPKHLAGIAIQELEHAISKELKITEVVKSNHKFKYLEFKPKDNSVNKLLEAYTTVYNKFSTTKFSEWLIEKDKIKIVDLSKHSIRAWVYYPQSKVHLMKNEFYLFGQFLGLRGRFLLIENYDNIIAFDERWLIGRTIEDYPKDYEYKIQQDTQLSLM